MLAARHRSTGAFTLYDIDGDGVITYDEMLSIVTSIYKMTGSMVQLPEDEDTPEKVRRPVCARSPLSRSRADLASCPCPVYSASRRCVVAAALLQPRNSS